jgi:lycopene beta-cyclase
LFFTGTGLAALMTAYKMVHQGSSSTRNILLLDENSKK